MNCMKLYSFVLCFASLIYATESNNVVEIKLDEGYVIEVDTSDKSFESTVLHNSQFLGAIKNNFKNRNVLVVLAFLGLIMGDEHVDLYFSGDKTITFPEESSECNSSCLHLKQKQFYVFGQYVGKYSEIEQVFNNNFSPYYIISGQKFCYIGNLKIHKHTFIDELSNLLFTLYDEIKNSYLVDDNMQNLFVRNKYTNPSEQNVTNPQSISSRLHPNMTDVYEQFFVAFIEKSSLSILLRCSFVFPEVIETYFRIRLQYGKLDATKILQIDLQGYLPNQKSNSRNKTTNNRVKVCITRKWMDSFKRLNNSENIHVLWPMLFSHVRELHLVMKCRYVSFEELLKWRTIIEGKNIGKFVASIFDIHQLPFYYFLEKISLDKSKISVLDLTGCSLCDRDLEVIRDLANLEVLHLPKVIESQNAIVKIFSADSSIGSKLKKLVYDGIIDKSEFYCFEKCPNSLFQTISLDNVEISDRNFQDKDKRFIKRLTFGSDKSMLEFTEHCIEDCITKCPSLNQIVLYNIKQNIGLPNLEVLSFHELTIKFCEMEIDLLTILHFCDSVPIKKVVLEKVIIRYPDDTESISSYNSRKTLQSFSLVESNLLYGRFYDLIKMIRTRKINFVQCNMDMNSLNQAFKSEQMKDLEELEISGNSFSNGYQLDIDNLTNLTSINIINVLRTSKAQKIKYQMCKFSSKRKPRRKKIYCTVLNLSLYPNLTSLVLDIYPKNYSSFKKNLFLAKNLKYLTLHVIAVRIDISKILERNRSIESLCVFGYRKSEMYTTEQEIITSTCKEIALIDIIIKVPTFWKYIANLVQIKTMDIKRLKIETVYENMVSMLYSRISHVRLVIYIKYTAGLVKALNDASNDLKQPNVSFIITDNNVVEPNAHS
ncbi:hypothetical protein THOM_1983 [Trachipleistophora hominis]|uniref:LRR containing protein n=1 Tax=Trachipleistophora hominis TaxID=72359 RepID=L7JUC3_TRAHO|nr:hypothetical protein THOM_1983 [Trachipleistophora hominis]